MGPPESQQVHSSIHPQSPGKYSIAKSSIFILPNQHSPLKLVHKEPSRLPNLFLNGSHTCLYCHTVLNRSSCISICCT